MTRRLSLLFALAALAAFGYGSTSHAANAGCQTGTAGGYPSVTCLNATWHCKTKQNHTQVRVTIDNGEHVDGIHVDAGCTGVFRATVATNGADSIKIHGGAHDLTIWGGPTTNCGHRSCAAIICTGKHGIVHQDGVQAMGGERVTLKWFKVYCPTGNNGGIYVHSGKGENFTPTDIVCEHCDLFEQNAAFHIGPGAVRSGARWSTLHDGKTAASPPNCRRIDKLAIDPVDVDNTCLTPK